MVRLALHGPQAALHPGDPLDSLPVLVRVVSETDLVFDVVAGGEIEHDGAALEDTFFPAARLVDDCWDTSVG